ncbi:TonB-dependent Receptor Plug Domain protein [bacterium BMS3Abin05]|nr:TonB-dependent Receptor Plug Domain protein [bacterium BMS3Abin05]GBE26885.1 TonB-dependent Receptor Plug Domain protein [bacterium BMS3Bbin03]HDZ12505.1 TonB-dependent receptor [Bacteroidota bacterium]
MGLRRICPIAGVFLLSFLMLYPLFLWAGTTGKIAGYVRDKSNNQPLPGANVIIVGTQMGAATDANGYFYIINIPPGVYKVQVRMIGYETVLMKNVRVQVDRTTKTNFSLPSTVLKLGKEIVVTAERPLIEPDITTKTNTISAEELKTMPVRGIADIMTLQSGIMEVMGSFNKVPGFDSRGIDDVHVRGGRNGEIAYMIDGMYVEDAIYAGMGTLLNREAIQELTIITGNFNAEYGQAQSSIVNIVTKEGGARYTGLMEASTGEIAGKLGSKPDDLRDAHQLIGSFGGPVPLIKRMNFFLSGSQSFKRYAVYQFDNIVYDPKNPDKSTWSYGAYRKAFEWDTIPGWRAFGFNHTWDFSGKLTYRFNPSMKLILTNRLTERLFRNFDWAWQYAEAGRHVVKDRTDQQGLIWTHQLSSSTFYNIRASRFWKGRTFRVHGINNHELTPGHADKLIELGATRDSRGFGPQEYPTRATVGGFYTPMKFVRFDTLTDGEIRQVYTGSATQYWTRTYQQTYEYSLSLTSQIQRHHQIKTGVEYKTYDLYFLEFQYPWIPNPYSEYYMNHPEEGSWYLQDKMEYENLIINAGIRFDYANSKGSMWEDPTNPGSPVVTGKKKYQWSPRLGIGHPITDKATFHFAYGQFFQVPEYRNLYTNNDRDLSTPRPLFGNPNLKAQRTIAYEVGIRQQIGQNWAVDITAWSKESSELTGTINVTGFDPHGIGLYDYYVMVNHDYGSSRGLDISIQKRYSNYFRGQLNYTYSVAKGNQRYSWSGYWNSVTDETEPKKEYLMPWDQPHTLDANVSIIFPRYFGPKVWKFKPLSEFYMNFIVRLHSGYPYTPSSGGQSLEPNSGRRPWFFSIDTMIRKDIRILGNTKIALFSRIYNLTDRKNPIYVYSETGSPTDPGPYASKTATSTYYDRPHYFGPRRTIDFGLQFLF